MNPPYSEVFYCPFCHADIFRTRPLWAVSYDEDVSIEGIKTALQLRAALIEEACGIHLRRRHRFRWFVYRISGRLPTTPSAYSR